MLTPGAGLREMPLLSGALPLCGSRLADRAASCFAVVAFRSPAAALSAGLRLWVERLGALVPLALLATLPGEGLRLALLLHPLDAPWQEGGVVLALLLSLLGTGFLTAAMIEQVAQRQPQPLASIARGALSRTLVVARTQLLLLLLLSVLVLPALPGALVLLRIGGGGMLGPLTSMAASQGFLGVVLLRASSELSLLSLVPCLLCAVLASYAGLRASLALTAAAADSLGGWAALRRSVRLSRRHLEDLLTFGLLVTAWMLPLLVLLLASTLVVQPEQFWLGYGLGLFLNFLVTLQGQGAAAGLALLYADACAHSGTPTRLIHMAGGR